MRFAVMGLGGAGGLLGARLAASGFDVTFIARGETLDAIRTSGLRVESTCGDLVVHPTHATNDPRDVGTVDFVILGVKAWQVPPALDAIRPLIGDTTAVLPLQNGVETVMQLVDALTAKHVLGGTARMSSINVGPGHIKHSALEPTLEIGELDASASTRIHTLCDALVKARIATTISSNVLVTMWMKFMLIAPWAGIGAITRSPIGTIRRMPETRAMLESALAECEQVARAYRVPLPADAVAQTLTELDNLPVHVTVSMQRDIVAGRPSELGVLTGAVVRLGARLAVPTPIHTLVYHLLLPLERNARGELADT